MSRVVAAGSDAIAQKRRPAKFAAANLRNPYTVWLEALERAQDALKRGELKLVEREIEYVLEKLEKVA